MTAQLIHAGTVTHEGKPRHYYTDERDALPASIKAYRVYIFDPEVTSWGRVLDAIFEAERQGEEIVWQVGERYYETGVTLERGKR